VDGGLLRGGLSGLVLHETGLLEGTLWLRRNPLGGRLSLGAEGTATLGEGALRAHLFAGLSEVPEADRAALGRTAHVKAFSVRWTREDGQVALVRELVEAALSDGGTLRWDGEGWRRDGGAPAEGDPGEPAPDGPEDQPKPP
jgi:hypothetical protein